MIATWLMAEIVSRAYRLALPSAILLAGFAAGSFFAGMGFAGQITGRVAIDSVLPGSDLNASDALRIGIGLLLTSLSLGVFYFRFRIPLAMTIIVATLFFGLWGIAAALAGGAVERSDTLLSLLFVVFVLGLAIRFDLTDIQRRTRRSDVAFWLYLLVGLSAEFALLADFIRPAALPDLASLIALLLSLAALAVVGLVFDRRLLISAPLVYCGVAIAHIDKQVHGVGMAPALWLIATAVLLLGLVHFWAALRATLLRRLPLGRLADLIPPASGR